MTWFELAIKFRDVGYLAVILLLFTWTQVLEKNIAQDRADAAEAVRIAEDKAKRLSDDLIIEQAIAMGVNRDTGVKYVDKIRNVTTPAANVVSDERMRLGNHGVRDLIESGDAKAGGGSNGRQLPQAPAGSRPR